MNEWLTVEQAAQWLAKEEGKGYFSPEILWRAIEQGFLQAHYWPFENIRIGLYDFLSEEPIKNILTFDGCFAENPDVDSEVLGLSFKCEFIGPVPFYNYAAFDIGKHLLIYEEEFTSNMIGITALDISGNHVGGCYVIGENQEPVSLGELDHTVLVHSESLGKYKENLTDPKVISHPNIEIIVSRKGTQVIGLKHANCAISGGTIPAFDDAASDAGQLDSTSYSKALAIAVHLIANMAERLDQDQSLGSKKLGLKRAGKPTIQAIAKELSKQASQLNFEGHGYGHRGFEELLRRALKTLE